MKFAFTSVTAEPMTRKDSEKDSDRPHYYSQFWLDVAAGRRVIGAPKPEESESVEPEVSEPSPAPRRASRPVQNEVSNGRGDIVHPVAEPVSTPDAFIEPDDEFSEVDDLEFQSSVEDADIPDVVDIDEDEEEEIFGEEEEEEEEEEDIGWGSTRGRKKPRVTRPTKAAPKKPGRREPRRGY